MLGWSHSVYIQHSLRIKRWFMKPLLLYLYCHERRDIQWNIAWARGKSQGRSPRDFLRAQVTIQTFLITNTALTFLGYQYWKSWFSVLHQQLGYTRKYYPVDWVNSSKIRGMDGVFWGLEGLLQEISRGRSSREIPRSSPDSPRKTLSITTLLIGFTFYLK